MATISEYSNFVLGACSSSNKFYTFGTNISQTYPLDPEMNLAIIGLQNSNAGQASIIVAAINIYGVTTLATTYSSLPLNDTKLVSSEWLDSNGEAPRNTSLNSRVFVYFEGNDQIAKTYHITTTTRHTQIVARIWVLGTNLKTGETV